MPPWNVSDSYSVLATASAMELCMYSEGFTDFERPSKGGEIIMQIYSSSRWLGLRLMLTGENI